MTSYVVGFLLSLIFTFSAYYFVVHKSITGNSLLALILEFAVLQMAVQIFFFLHLGRGPKPLYNVFFFAGTVGIILMTVGGSIFIMNSLYNNMSPSEITKKLAQDEGISQVEGAKTGACQELGANHKVTIKNARVTPVQTNAHLCDTLSIINDDSVNREMAFGPHDKHINYAGLSEFTIHKSYAKTITLNQTGTYRFHDHDDAAVAGTFTVTSEKE